MQAHPAAESFHVAQEPLRLRQGDAAAGRREHGVEFSHRTNSWTRRCRSARCSSWTPRTSGSTTTPSSCGGAFPTRTASRSAIPRSSSSSATRTCRTAAETDVRPQIFGDYRIKFKAEALPLKDSSAAIAPAVLAQRGVPVSSRPREGDPTSLETLIARLPGARRRSRSRRARRSSWSGDTIVEEVLQDIGDPRLRRGDHRQGQRRAVARPRRPPAAHRRVRVPDQVQAARGPARGGDAAGRERSFSRSSTPRRTGSPSERRRPASCTV